MQSADLNLTTTVTGHQRFLFIKLPADSDKTGNAAAGLAETIRRLGNGMENMHYMEGPPSAEAFRRGRFQILRAEPAMSREQGLSHPAVTESDGLIRLEAEDSEPLLKYEDGLRALLNSAGGSVETLSGVQRPRSYTSHAMTQYAYATGPTAGPWERSSLGRGHADEQECRMVGHGLDAPGKPSSCPGTARRKKWW